ncbi:transposase [Streptomyces sp. NPDC051644]|uniref:transposase n=1 Tax=Streptomyces sp. NPDC051644 TaxID=3365666 RepID=UPI003793F676
MNGPGSPQHPSARQRGYAMPRRESASSSTCGSPCCPSVSRTWTTSTPSPASAGSPSRFIAETGRDMAVFVCAPQLASWIGVCPGRNESAGVSRSRRTRRNSNLKRLREAAAMATIRDKTSYPVALFRRICAVEAANGSPSCTNWP